MSALNGKHVMITGGGRGIGAVIAAAFAKEAKGPDGVRLSLLGRQQEALAKWCRSLKDEYKVSTLACVADVTQDDSLAQAFTSSTNEHGAVDILINNAGAAESSPVKDKNFAVWGAYARSEFAGQCAHHSPRTAGND